MTRPASLDLGVTGNCIISALVDREARVVWSCLPRLDGDPVFHALVDDGDREDARGFWAIELVGLERTEQEYLPNTAVLVTRLYSSNGSAVEVTDFCPRFERGGRMFRPQMLVRSVRTLAGTPRVRVRLRPSFGYGALAPEITHGSNHIRYVSPDRVLRLTTDAPASYLLAETPFALERSMHFVLGADETLEESPARVAREFQEETEAHWRQWTRRLAIPPEWQDAVIRAAITLKLCTFEETGAIVAAMTTSIPEAAGSQRNWDYRYCWLRDAFFVVRALNSLSEVDTMEHYLRYLTNVVGQATDGHLQPVYGIALETSLVEHEVPTLSGYRGMGPVRVGNQAFEHLQHDVYGNVVLATAQSFFDRRLLRPATDHDFLRLERVGEQAYRVYATPDASMWELRTRERVHTSSALMC
ncbi:MAG TPA: glycoside hydrolase family 15 protein, partial [Steroidobacteraceae bacterium]|nr:glycoside hydrolase family 15 protein [Steroidobacteraceae bacterium]